MEVFLVRNNFGSKNEKQKLNDDIRKSLYDLNEVGILIDQPNEKDYWESRINNTDYAGKKHLFIDRWLQLLKALENEDV
jgi:hypothetical protein